MEGDKQPVVANQGAENRPERSENALKVSPPVTPPLAKSSPQSRRAYVRSQHVALMAPVSCVLWVDGEALLRPKIVNYHFLGACLQVTPGDRRCLAARELDFYLGNRCLQSKLRFKLAWEDITQSGTFGIQFEQEEEKKEALAGEDPGSARIAAHPLIAPTVVGWDPLNPLRKLYFQLVNFSQTRMRLATSASNNLLFPGMLLERCTLSIPDSSLILFDCAIAKVATGQAKPNTLEVEVTIQAGSQELTQALTLYALFLSPTKLKEEDRFQYLAETHQVKSHDLKAGLTYRIITEQSEYEDVLKLRFLGYQRAGKTRDGATWLDMGDGLASEGSILAVFLQGQLVGSIELRLGKDMPLRVAHYLTPEQMRLLQPEKTIEPNKLVVHPGLQGSDIVVGLIQRVQAMSVIHGYLDVLLLATDQLAPFYSKMGGRALGIKVPHPVLKDQALHVMLFEASMYARAIGVNPYFWSQMWQVTHDYLTRLDVTEAIRPTLDRRVRSLYGQALWRLAVWHKKIKRKKKQRRQQQKAATTQPAPAPPLAADAASTPPVPATSKATLMVQPQAQSGSIDPGLTEKHFSVQVLTPYLLQAQEMIGEPKVKAILASLGLPASYFKVQSNWVSVAFFDRFIQKFKAFGSVEDLQLLAGRRAMRKEVLGITYYFLKHFISFEATLKAIGRVAMWFNTTRTYELQHLKPGHCYVQIGVKNRALLPQDLSACLNWIGNFEGVIQLKTGRAGEVKKIACALKGDAACIYELIWERTFDLPRFLALSLPFLLSGLTLAVLLAGLWRHPGALSSGSGGWLPNLLLLVLNGCFLVYYYQFTTLSKAFEVYHQESDDRYVDLQQSKAILEKNFREATLLETLAREVQVSGQLNQTLNSTVRAICEKFGFSRSFIMLAERSKNILRTHAVAGDQENAELIWNFVVDVAKPRDNPLVLSSVYFTSQPLLITDLNEQAFQFNPESLLLIKTLKTNGFVIVAIPSAKQNWGVIVADKASTLVPVNESDLTMLKRVAQHLGIALDKKAELEQEEKLRTIFQKYVPSRVVGGVMNGEEPVLGGQLKTISVVFMDLRGYTHLSSIYPPEIILDVLNKFFSLVAELAEAHQGNIDKFFGDGVLITWGTVLLDPEHVAHALACALALLGKMAELNASLKAVNLPEIDVGIGINSGEALVGNIGSAKRMEFTAIGATVNLAFRLEALVKDYDSQVVVSDTVFKALNLQSKPETWRPIEQVAVRGLDQPVSIAVLRRQGG